MAVATAVVVLVGAFGVGVMVGFDWCRQGDNRMMAAEARGDRCAL